MFRSIIVPIDLEQPSSWAKALPVARTLAGQFSSRFSVVTVVPSLEAALQAEWTALAYRKLMDEARVRLASLLDSAGNADATIEVGCGNIWREILRLAEAVEADMIVLASHRPEMRDYLIGANASRIVRHARCSVMVVRE